jgi:hypothetical protein
MTSKIYLSAAIGFAILALGPSLNAQTMPRKASSPSPSATATAVAPASPAKQAGRPIPFHGMISAVDQTAKTFTITGKETSRVFNVTDKTAITKGGSPATMTDITENQEVSGSYWKHPDDTLEAKKVKLGPMQKAKASPSPAESPKAIASPAASPKTSGSPKP